VVVAVTVVVDVTVGAERLVVELVEPLLHSGLPADWVATPLPTIIWLFERAAS
jgi:hypothetical protein